MVGTLESIKNKAKSETFILRSPGTDSRPTPHFQIDHAIDFNLHKPLNLENLNVKPSKTSDRASQNNLEAKIEEIQPSETLKQISSFLELSNQQIQEF